MSNFYLDAIVKSPHFHSTSPINDLSLLEPNMRRKVLALLDESNKQGHPLYAFETYRSTDRQRLLYDQGATQLKKVGVHHYGLACDFVLHDAHGNPSWDGDFSFILKLCRNHNLISGIDWGTPNQHHTFLDQGHVQLCSVKDQPKLFAGSWYPDDNYNPYT